MSLAEMFDCSVDYLLGKTRNPTPYPKARGGDKNERKSFNTQFRR